MLSGLVIKTYNIYYLVLVESQIIRCRLRGRFRREGLQVFTGDRVKVKLLDEGTGVIEDLLPRKSLLVRPPVANVDQVICVFSIRQPAVKLSLVDRLLVQAEKEQLAAVLCLNKIDLLDQEEIEEVAACYRPAGYPVLPTSARYGMGLEELRSWLEGRISVLAGPSGVGKSRLLNALHPGLQLRTGELSEKAGRGRHTTRHVELLSIAPGGWVADTPGFSVLEPAAGMEAGELAACFPEIKKHAAGCRFSNCLHRHEPRCAVKKAVEEGNIPYSRYEHYLQILQEIEELKRR